MCINMLFSDVFRSFGRSVYWFGCPNSGPKKHFSIFLFSEYFKKKYVEVAINDSQCI